MKAKRKATKRASKITLQTTAEQEAEQEAMRKAERSAQNKRMAEDMAETIGAALDTLRPQIQGIQRGYAAAAIMPAILPFFANNTDGKFSCDLDKAAAVALTLADRLQDFAVKTDAEIAAILRPPQPAAEPPKSEASPA